MKKCAFIVLVLLYFRASSQENNFSVVNLSEYCPYKQVQFKTTCYAYAVAYTAMSTEYNIQHNINDSNIINRRYFSPGVVASYHNSSLRFYQRSWNCGRNGTADQSLDILKSNGTTFNNQYDCDCKRYSQIQKELKPTDTLYKISDYKTLEIKNRYSTGSVNWIKSALQKKHPVIIGVYQYDRLYDIDTKDISDTIPDEETMRYISKNQKYGVSNHVACILGYNDNYSNGRGYFLIKNNFQGWGNGIGFSWVPYTFILPLIHEAYFIESKL